MSFDAHAFVTRWASVYEDLKLERIPDLFEPEATIRQPTTRGAISPREAPECLASLKALVPDARLEATRWSETENGVFIEWRLTGTLADRAFELFGVDRYVLRGDRATEGCAYFDTYELWARLDPTMRRAFTLEELAHHVLNDRAPALVDG
jgi:hypothetical protein